MDYLIFCSSIGLIQRLFRENDAWKVGNAGAWKANKQYKEGAVLSVCLTLCNITFKPPETAEIVPHVNQNLLAPGCAQEDLVAYAKSVTFFLKPIAH